MLMKLLFNLIKLFCYNLYLITFIFLPYALFRFLLPLLSQITTLGDPDSIIQWANSSYWKYLTLYLGLSLIFGLKFNAENAYNSAEGLDGWQSVDSQSANAFDLIIATIHLILIPGKICWHALNFNLQVLGIKRFKSPIDEFANQQD